MVKLNRVYETDNLPFLRKLDASVIDLIYIDPPFYSQGDYTDFNDKWETIEAYLEFMRVRIVEMYRVLKDTGTFYLHCDRHASHYLKIECDKVFGYNKLRSEIIWKRHHAHCTSKTLDNVSDSIFLYTKSDKFTFYKQVKKLKGRQIEENYPYRERETGRRYRTAPIESSSNINNKHEIRIVNGRKFKTSLGWKWTQKTLNQRIKENPYLITISKNNKLRYKVYFDNKRKFYSNIWVDLIGTTNNKDYETQKPTKLLKRIITQSSNINDIVADFFMGSGTTLAVAKKLRRRWLGTDINPESIEITNNRLNNIPAFKSLNAYS